jgi:hypothetical protein
MAEIAGCNQSVVEAIRVFMKKRIVSLGLFGMILCGLPAKAGNIVINSSFDSGFLPGWHLSSVNSPWSIDSVDRTGFGNNISNLCGGATCLGPGNGLYQDLLTVPGQSYDLSFWAYFEPGQRINPTQIEELYVTWGGALAIDILNPVVPDDVYAQYFALPLVATSTTTRLQFFGRDDAGAIGMDDVSVTPNPEPSTFLLIGGGLLIFAARRRHLLPK